VADMGAFMACSFGMGSLAAGRMSGLKPPTCEDRFLQVGGFSPDKDR
jgi:hypothetical protein